VCFRPCQPMLFICSPVFFRASFFDDSFSFPPPIFPFFRFFVDRTFFPSGPSVHLPPLVFLCTFLCSFFVDGSSPLPFVQTMTAFPDPPLFRFPPFGPPNHCVKFPCGLYGFLSEPPAAILPCQEYSAVCFSVSVLVVFLFLFVFPCHVMTPTFPVFGNIFKPVHFSGL